MEKTVLKVNGMTCGHCSMSVTKALKEVPGVAEADVDLAAKTATVTYDTAKAGLADLKKAVEEAGYEIA